MTRAQELRAEVSEIAHESFDGAMVVKTLGREGEETERFATKARELRDVNIRAGRIRAAFDPTLAALPNLGVLVVLAVGVSRVLSGATVLSAPALLPTVTEATVTVPAVAAAGAVSAGPGIASVGAEEVGSGVAVWLCSCFLQPARASAPTRASSRGEVSVLEWIFMRWCSLDGMMGRARCAARVRRG
jgi:ABC-type multidrug transport system fused ATPase/permease subunit